MYKRLLLILSVIFLMTTNFNAQKIALKTNILYDATTTMNLGIEIGLSDKWTMDISGNYNPWTFADNTKWKHWLVQPELRYWFCQKFNGNFVGVHLLGGQYNVGNINNSIDILGTDFSKLSDYRFDGWAVGLGVAYGYSWMLSKHWNIEAEIGIGYIYTKFDQYKCEKCGESVGKNIKHNYYGPTKAAINLIYTF